MIRYVKWLFVVVLAVGLTACRPDPTGPFDLPGQGRRSSDEKNFLDPGTFPYNRIESGGVPKDGIPALTDPVRVPAGSSEADYLRDVDLVMGVVIHGEAVAYPHNIGWHHEIVNDVVGGQPIVVSFCPLTGTGLVFNGLDADGSRLTCGVSGLLFNNNLIMYDRRDDKTLYPQMIHKGINEPRLNQELELLPVVETTWRMWKQLYPETQVVGGFTGIFSPGQYRSYPYGGYRSPNASPMFRIFPSTGSNPIGEVFPPKELTLGVRFGETAKGYPFSVLAAQVEGVVNDVVAGNPLAVVFYMPDRMAVPYFREVDGQVLTLERIDATDGLPFMLRDQETGSQWNMRGEAVAGPLQGKRLTQVPAHNAFWFAWATFWQDSQIYQ